MGEEIHVIIPTQPIRTPHCPYASLMHQHEHRHSLSAISITADPLHVCFLAASFSSLVRSPPGSDTVKKLWRTWLSEIKHYQKGIRVARHGLITVLLSLQFSRGYEYMRVEVPPNSAAYSCIAALLYPLVSSLLDSPHAIVIVMIPHLACLTRIST